MLVSVLRFPSYLYPSIRLSHDFASTLQVFDSKFIVPEGKNMMLRLKAKVFSFSGDSYKIVDANDSSKIVFQCLGKFLNFDNKRVICDADGAPIFVIKEPLMQLDEAWYQ